MSLTHSLGTTVIIVLIAGQREVGRESGGGVVKTAQEGASVASHHKEKEAGKEEQATEADGSHQETVQRHTAAVSTVGQQE